MDKTEPRSAAGAEPRRDPRAEDLRKLGARVRSLRADRGLTQLELAVSLGLSVAYISLIEAGGRNPPYTTVVAIARALGVSPRDVTPQS